MIYEIILSPEAVADLRSLKANARAVVRDALVKHLRHTPTKTSKSRVKRLQGLSQPQYRLRVGHMRVYYDVAEGRVEILAIVPKTESQAWLEKVGKIE